MSSSLKNLIEQEFRARDKSASPATTKKKAHKKAKKRAGGGLDFVLADEAPTAQEEAVEALLGLSDRGRVAPDVARAIREHRDRQKRAGPARRDAEESGKRAKKDEGTVFSEEDFAKWSQAYFINSKVGDDDASQQS